MCERRQGAPPIRAQGCRVLVGSRWGWDGTGIDFAAVAEHNSGASGSVARIRRQAERSQELWISHLPNRWGSRPQSWTGSTTGCVSYVDGGKLAGALTMVARRGEVFHFQPHGVADLESGAPMERDTIFRLYSMTKPITTLAAMMLYEEERFSLDDRVDRFIPELADMKVFDGMDGERMRLVDQERPITIRHLLTHTAGLSYGFDPNNPVDAMYRERRVIDPDSDLREFAAKIGSIPLVCQPGEKWTYSLATTVLGYLAQVVSGQPLDELLRDRVFTPLGMTDTTVLPERVGAEQTCDGVQSRERRRHSPARQLDNQQVRQAARALVGRSGPGFHRRRITCDSARCF